jgi:hypothetical protein
LIETSKVLAVCTTDDPVDSLNCCTGFKAVDAVVASVSFRPPSSAAREPVFDPMSSEWVEQPTRSVWRCCVPKRRVSIMHRFTARHLFACTLLVVVCAAPARMTADELCAGLETARELRSKVNKLASELKEIELTIKIQELAGAIRSATEAMGEGMNVWGPNSMVTVILGEDEEDDEDEAEAEAGTEVDVEADACAASREYDLVGTWKACDGREVTFTLENCEFKGRYTNLSDRLRKYGFKEKELGYIVIKMTKEGGYSGQVKWRFLDGKSRWADTNITISGNRYTDDGSDDCSRTMERVRK